MVAFEADSIQPTDTYVGNIKPGETGNVDVMLSAIAPTMDEGKIKVRITYEDESGEVQPEVEKELSLYVVEAMEEDPGLDMEVGGMMEMPVEEDSFFERYKLWIGAGAAAAAVAAFVIVRRRKKKKAQQEEDDLGDEIS